MSYNEQEYDAFEAKMHASFPKMFAKPYGGFEVSKGWWPIIKALCSNIQHNIDWKQEQLVYGNGTGCPQVEVLQIKEKFGVEL